MTTTVHIAVAGNKHVSVRKDGAQYVLKPNAHMHLTISGQEQLKIEEHGDFVSVDPSYEYRPPAAGVPPHIVRVMEEASELAGRIGKLEAFTDGPLFGSLPDGERQRMYEQLGLQKQLLAVLEARIEANAPKG